MPGGDNDNSVENGESHKDKINEPVDWSMATKEQCVDYIEKVLSIDTTKAQHLQRANLLNLSITQQRALAINAEGMVNSSRGAPEGKLHKGQTVVILDEPTSADVITQFKEFYAIDMKTREAKQKEEKEKENNNNNRDDIFEEMNEFDNNNQFGYTKYGRGGKRHGFANHPRSGLKGISNSSHNGGRYTQYTGRKRKRSQINDDNFQQIKEPVITRGFEAIYEQLKKEGFRGFRKFKNGKGEEMYFWWSNGKCMASNKRPIGCADDDDIHDKGFQAKMRNDKFFSYNRRRPIYRGGRSNRVCLCLVFIYFRCTCACIFCFYFCVFMQFCIGFLCKDVAHFVT